MVALDYTVSLLAPASVWPDLSHPLHKAIHHALLPRLVEIDGQLVAVDGGNVAVAEFLVEDAVAEGEGRGGAGGFGDEFAFDGEGEAGCCAWP